MSYYEQYIAALENGEQVVATFEFDGSVYNIQIVNKNSLLTVTPPQSTAYVIFNGWTVNGELIDLETFRITENTKIVADVTHKYLTERELKIVGFDYNAFEGLELDTLTIRGETQTFYLLENSLFGTSLKTIKRSESITLDGLETAIDSEFAEVVL